MKQKAKKFCARLKTQIFGEISSHSLSLGKKRKRTQTPSEASTVDDDYDDYNDYDDEKCSSNSDSDSDITISEDNFLFECENTDKLIKSVKKIMESSEDNSS